MEKNSKSVSNPQPIMLGWLIALLLVSGIIAISRGTAYVIGRMIETRSPEYLMPAAVSVMALAFVLFVSYRFMPAYWRRNRHGCQVLICKFRGSRETIGYFLPDGMQPQEFVRSLSGSVLRDGRFLTYRLGGWFKTPGRFVCIKSGRIIDQECRIDRAGWPDRDLAQQKIRVKDMIGNMVITSASALLLLGEVSGGTAFNWSDNTRHLAERMHAIDRVAAPPDRRPQTFS